MKTKPFTQTRTFFVLFCIAFWLLMFFAIPSEGKNPKHYKGHAKIERKYKERRAHNLAEQERIQSKNPIKRFNARKAARQYDRMNANSTRKTRV
jgi:hypothetical protein